VEARVGAPWLSDRAASRTRTPKAAPSGLPASEGDFLCSVTAASYCYSETGQLSADAVMGNRGDARII